MNIAILKEIGSLMNFETDETIIQQGEIGEDMFILLQGNVEVIIISEFVGHEVRIAQLQTGDIFGEMSMIEDKPRSATVRAIKKCTVFRIHKDRFAEFITKDSSVAVKMLEILSNRLVDVKHKTRTGEAKVESVQETELDCPPNGNEKEGKNA